MRGGAFRSVTSSLLVTRLLQLQQAQDLAAREVLSGDGVEVLRLVVLLARAIHFLHITKHRIQLDRFGVQSIGLGILREGGEQRPGRAGAIRDDRSTASARRAGRSWEVSGEGAERERGCETCHRMCASACVRVSALLTFSRNHRAMLVKR